MNILNFLKNIFLITLILFSYNSYTQNKNCDFEFSQVTDTTSIKVMSERIISERIFGNTTSFLTFKIFEVDGVLGLNFQYLQKSADLISPICLDKNSKLHLQIFGGKEITLINSTNNEICNDLQYDPISKNNIRILSGYFYFLPTNFELLKTEKLVLIRFETSTGNFDMIVQPEITSEITKITEYPENFFIDRISCFGI